MIHNDSQYLFGGNIILSKPLLIKPYFVNRVDSGNLPAGKLPGFTGILRLPLPDFVPKLPEFTVP